MIDSEREEEIRQIIQEPQYFVVLYDYFKIRIMDETRLFVAAIDFGTTYSGFAFSARGDTTIYTCEWRNNDLTSMKTPTSVLLDNEQKLKAFGYDADNKYITSIVPDEEMDDYYYFRRFKMKLHNERITLDTMLTEERGKQMKALEIFCIAIKYLKEQMIKKLNSKFLTMKVAIKKEDIQYVLTVPAIWADQSKLFMRKAAEKADIDKDQLKLALEPEVASIYCQELRLDVEKEANRFLQTIKPGMKFMVIDLGGGTADITVHEQQQDETLEEVVPPSGGPWGGTSVDNAYIEFLKELFGAEVVEGLRKEDLEDYFHLLHEFEIKKRSITTKSETNIVITMPVGLIDLVKHHKGNMNNQIKRTKYKDTVSVEGQKLHIKPNTFRNLFKETIDKLLDHLTELFADPLLSNLKNVIMVGGFSECELVQTAVRKEFGENRKIIIPDESGLAVLKGAVLFGRQKKKITKRVLKKTYGIQSWPEWDPDIHPETKKIRMGGTDRCKDVFFKFASIRDKVEEGFASSQIFQALNPNEKTLECAIYTSTDPNPRYVTDPTCQRLGNLIVDLPKLKDGETLEIEETLFLVELNYYSELKI